MTRFLGSIGLGVVFVLGAAHPAWAIVDDWNNNVGGSFTLNTNWTDASNPANHVVPGPNDYVIFNRNLNIAYNVTFPGRPILTPLTREVLSLDVGTNTVSFPDSVNFNQLPAAFTVNPNNGFSFGTTIGGTSGQVATLSTTLASFTTDRVSIGIESGATGTLNVNGGTFNVTHTPFEDFYEFVIGQSGDGALTITGGAHVNVTGAPDGDNVVLAESYSGHGTALVSGAGSTWAINGDLAVRPEMDLGSDTGILTVEAGGTLTTHSAELGHNGTITVSGAGSTWTNANDITIGGLLNTENGGQVASGAATLTGGTLWVFSGSHLTTGTAEVAKFESTFGPQGSKVVVSDSDSSWIVNGDLAVGDTGNAPTSYAQVSYGGNISVSGLLTVRSSGVVYGNGTITGIVTNGGLVAPSVDALVGGPGFDLHVNGDYTQSAAGKLEIELGGTSPGSNYDQLLVDGAVSLNGTLRVLLTSSFLPVGGNSFKILDWTGSTTGTFSSLQLPALYGGLAWNISQLYFTGTLSVGGVLGDYNGNGIVDAADFTVWRNSLGRTGDGLAADGNGNKQIDSGDFDVWKLHYGATAPPGLGSSAAIPEPASWAWLMFAAGGLAIRRCPAINQLRPLQSMREEPPKHCLGNS